MTRSSLGRRPRSPLSPRLATALLATGIAGLCAATYAAPRAEVANGAPPSPQPTEPLLESSSEAVPAAFHLTAAPTPILAQLGATSASAWPALPYEQFLPNAAEESTRRALYPLFHTAESQARTFAPGRWIPVVRVQISDTGAGAGDWSPTGVIEVKPTTDSGAMFHEMFHPAFHNSEFHPSNSDRDGAWNEAFCNAFRYYVEPQLIPDSPWPAKIDRFASMTADEVLSTPGSFRMRKYVYPTTLVIKRLGGRSGSLDSLRTLWFQLIAMRRERGGPVLDDFFGYAPPLHKDE